MKPDSPHKLDITPHPGRVVVAFAGRIVVETSRALDLVEGSMRPVLYVPRQDADMAAFVPTERHTHCPFKGEASYFTLKAEGREAQNAVWSYEAPLPGAEAIAGHLAFYPDQVEIRQG
ncbi:DUF427 domain-containing protein [Lichenibacterium ramalinae]|uniref:DUF427 domain-containing protein n=1 Tax=Lichenibacterium ramalinae TaxID=2316527 RepID=A0A4V1RIG6_9HYPH|nr:DUF427 domain-containing protein [Lichenibacterium ramalinae]RYB03835.1 DUF427 domain-containing protein [Lichenibacterium ramalinae]